MQVPKSNKIKLMWADEEFVRWFKSQASTEGLSMLEYSRKIVKTKENKGKNETFKFGL